MIAPRNERRRGVWRATMLAAVLAAAGCGSPDDPNESTSLGPASTAGSQHSSSSEADSTPAAGSPAASLLIVVSEPPIADLVTRVAGDRATVTSIVALGADSHTYQPLPSDARALAEADLYIENGLELNPVVTEFARTNSRDGTPHHALADVVPATERISTDSEQAIASHGHAHNFNAHFWPDPVYARAYVLRIGEILAETDPSGATDYRARATELAEELERLDAAFAAAIGSIPDEHRKLVVYHDSWSYFGRRYDLPVVGAIQPADFSEPSAAELRDLVALVRIQEVPAFFGSEVFPSDVLRVIEAETGSVYVADLSDDALPGEPGTAEHSYVGMMVANVRAIVTALGGDAALLDSVDPARS